MLIRGWEYVRVATFDKFYKSKDYFWLRDVSQNINLIILRKPETVGVDEVLNPTMFGGFKCDKS